MSMFSTIFDSLKLLTSTQQRDVLLNILANIVNALLELFTLGTAIPLIIFHISQGSGSQGDFGYFSFLTESRFFQGSLIDTLLILLALLILKNLLGSLISAYQFNTCFRIANTLSEKMLTEYMDMDYYRFSHSNSGTMSHEINHIPLTFTQKVLVSLINLSSELVVIFLISLFLLILTPQMFLITAGFLSVTTLIALYLKRKVAAKIDQGFKKQVEKTSKRLMMALDSFVQAKLFDRQTHFSEAYMKEYRTQSNLLSKNQFIQTMSLRILEVTSFAGILIVLWWFLKGNYSNEDIAIALGLFATATYKLIPSLTKIINANTSIRSSKHSVDLLLKNLINKSGGVQSNDPPIDNFENIEAMNLGLSVDGRSLFNQVNFSITRGEILGIMAPSGFGKSSLLKVLSGLIAPTQGHIQLNRERVNLHNNKDWFQKIAYLDQQPLILDTTIAENLIFDSNIRESDTQRLREVLEQVGLGSWVGSKKDGLSSLVGENGVMMSGGEKRRFALARALLRNPIVYLMDEITNDLDEQTSAIIYSLVKQQASNGKLIIWVSHDQDSYEWCDQVIELDRIN